MWGVPGTGSQEQGIEEERRHKESIKAADFINLYIFSCYSFPSTWHKAAHRSDSTNGIAAWCSRKRTGFWVREVGSNFDSATHYFYVFFKLANTLCFPFAKHCSKHSANIYCATLDKCIRLLELRCFLCKMETIVPCIVLVKYKHDNVCKVLWTGHNVW